MDIELRYLLIKITCAKGDVAALEKMGYTYAKIASVFSELINEDIFKVNDQLEFELTEKGSSYYRAIEAKVLKNKKLYIKPMDDYRIEKKSKYDIFIE